MGHITFIDNAVDATTGTIKIKGSFPNEDRRLWPGQFVNVVVTLKTDSAVVVPTAAIQAGQQGDFAFVVKADQTVDLRQVMVDRAAGEESIIKNGLKAGETVITDVQSMIARTSRKLPTQMPAPPSYQKVNHGDDAVMQLVLYSSTLPSSQVDEYAESTIAQRISTVPGVAQVQVGGAAKYAVRVDLDPRNLSAHGIGIDEAASAIQSANVNLPTGTIYGADHTYTILANGQMLRAREYASTIVAYRNGNPVRLDAVAHVYDGIENDKSPFWFNGERAISLSVQKQPGTNVVAVVDAVKALLPEFRAQLPPSITLDIRSDRSIAIRESVQDIKMTLLLTIGLAVLVIFLFLRNI